MRIMNPEELKAIAGASTVGDVAGCAGAIATVGALVLSDGTAAAAIEGLLATTAGKATVFSAIAGMAGGCINLYDDLAPPEWQSAQLISDFFNTVGMLYDYGVDFQMHLIDDIVPDDGVVMTGHVEVIFQDQVQTYDYEFTGDDFSGT
jgi:hypothetical protein